MVKQITYGGGGSAPSSGKAKTVSNLFGAGAVGQAITQPQITASEAIRLRQQGYLQRADGTWYKPASPDTRDPDGNLISTPPPAWNGDTSTLGQVRSNQVNNAPKITPSSLINSTTAGGGGGTTPSSPVTGGASSVVNTAGGGGSMPGSTTNTGSLYLNSLIGGEPNSGYSGQFTANQLGAALVNPGVFSRGVLRQNGQDETSGYGSILAGDMEDLAPIVAFLQAGGGQGDSATMANALGSLMAARSQAGGGGGIDESILSQVFNPNGAEQSSMLGLMPGDVSDVSLAAQPKPLNDMLISAANLGLNPWAASAYADMLTQAQTGYQDSYMHGGMDAASPYLDWLRNQGVDRMYQGR